MACHGQSDHGRRRREVLGGLADLPVAVGEGPLEGGGDLGGPGVLGRHERGQRQHGTPADRRLVGRRGEDGVEPAVVADGPERGHRGLAHERLAPGAGAAGETDEHGRGSSSATTSCSPHAQAATSTTDGSSSASAAVRSTSGWRAAISAARRRTPASGSASAAVSVASSSAPEALQGAERGRPHAGIVVGEPADGRRRRRRCARRRRRPAGRSLPEQVGQRRDDPGQGERRDGGDDRADHERQPGAGDDRPHPAQRSGRVVRRGDGLGDLVGRRRRGVSYGLRGRLGCALAVLRHPANSRATTARPAIQAIRTVRSLIDTQDETLTPAPPQAAGTVRAPRRGPPRPGRSRSRCSPS